MKNILNYSEEIKLIRIEKEDGSYEYRDEQTNLSYDKHGSSLDTQKVKFETLLVKDSKQSNKANKKLIKLIKQKTQTQNSLNMNTKFSAAVHSFTQDLFKQVLEKYDGKVVGSDDMDLDSMMKEFFGDFKPGKAVKAAKVKDDKPKKKRALSGYTYFGQQQKSKFDVHVKKVVNDGGEKPKFVTFAAAEWKKLSDAEKAEWSEKAKALKKEKCKDEDEGDDQ